jgi:FtsH-binding integral membrane protein
MVRKLTLYLLLVSVAARVNNISTPECHRYDTWSSKTNSCVTRHVYLGHLVIVNACVFMFNIATKCQRSTWYTWFFVYNILINIGIGSVAFSYQGKPISDQTFYTMVGLLGVGTVALVVKYILIIKGRCRRIIRQSNPERKRIVGNPTQVSNDRRVIV